MTASKSWVWVAAFAVLFAGITNAHAHLHLCFDGQEAPASVHLGDEQAHALGHDHLPGHAGHADDAHGAGAGFDHHLFDHHRSASAHGAALDHDVHDAEPSHDADHGGASHDADHGGTPHDDVDVDVDPQALAKAFKHDVAALAPAPSWSYGFAAAGSGVAPLEADAPPHPRVSYSRPPSRAPPR